MLYPIELRARCRSFWQETAVDATIREAVANTACRTAMRAHAFQDPRYPNSIGTDVVDRSREVLLNRKPCARPWQRETDGRRCSQEIGRGRGIRTPDIQLPKLALYQTELYPEDPAGDRGADAPWYGHAGGRVNARHICATRKSRGRRSYRRPRSRMARPERFELPTTKFVAWYSIQLSYGRSEPNSRLLSVAAVNASTIGWRRERDSNPRSGF